ncbi:MAG: hypothetical protein A2Z60_01795 [Nitrospirae bacterium RIFCSPLOWO2_02_42_7]|nr:MAG: hypothetical protein A2Z60_01795 [Nitrospirae bacterium RIFCSPLOWO2_02_42_7]
MNHKLKEVFKGKVINKAYTINTGIDEFPRHVLEYLIDSRTGDNTVGLFTPFYPVDAEGALVDHAIPP